MPAHYTSVLLKCWLCGFRTPPVLNIVIRWLIWVIRHIQGYHHKEETYASNIYKFQPQRTPVRGAIGYVKHPKKSHCYSHPVRTTPLDVWLYNWSKQSNQKDPYTPEAGVHDVGSACLNYQLAGQQAIPKSICWRQHLHLLHHLDTVPNLKELAIKYRPWTYISLPYAAEPTMRGNTLPTVGVRKTNPHDTWCTFIAESQVGIVGNTQCTQQQGISQRK